MTRVQWCRDHIDEVKENCGLSERTVQEVNQASDFVEANREISRLPTTVILTVIRIKDKEIREKVLLSVKNSLESNKHPVSGLFNQEITAKDIKDMVAVLSPKKEEKPKEKETIAPTPSAETAAIATPISEDGILAMCETRDGGKPCQEISSHPGNKSRYCGINRFKISSMSLEHCPKVKAAMESAAKVAGVPVDDVKPITNTAELDAHLKTVYEGSRPHDKTGPFTPASEIPKGLVDLNTPDTRVKEDVPETKTETPKLILRTLPLPAAHIPPRDIVLSPTTGQWRAIHNAIMRGDVKPDEKAGKDVWDIGSSRAWEKGCELI